ncbi:DUF1707 and DUF4870 domain-containing protein [Actinomadura parmotrematis]|uniref:DUF1707 and DUF4870 domain-containing protein n=1 Tax=Actinomadura parmotrematis TaxID=2864039 RepID=A0ABS7G735_9ACTN|nr:DUF1707 and DUF4870 domain-containing protein [Actinomadura parmotrematis]MBW8487617.1 DUF1707 and DUF4870 domain-containing protein [Actinomadura parmotrematis]
MSEQTLGHLRVSDAERDAVVDRLQHAYGEGRLDHEEFDMRAHLAMTAKTRADLDVVLVDLAPPPAARTEAGPADDRERVYAALAHVLAIPTLFVGPLVLMLVAGGRAGYVRRHAVEAINFQLTLLLVTVVTFGVGGMLYAVAWIASCVAAVAALAGSSLRYPLTLRLIR